MLQKLKQLFVICLTKSPLTVNYLLMAVLCKCLHTYALRIYKYWLLHRGVLPSELKTFKYTLYKIWFLKYFSTYPILPEDERVFRLLDSALTYKNLASYHFQSQNKRKGCELKMDNFPWIPQRTLDAEQSPTLKSGDTCKSTV